MATTINYPAAATALFAKISLTGVLNATGSLEYFNTDGVTSLWGPKPFNQAASNEYPLVNKPGETAAQQNGRYAFVLGVLENYGQSPAGATVTVEFFAMVDGQKELLAAADTLFNGGN
jgi:hypothetical protein